MEQRGELIMWLHETLEKAEDIKNIYYASCKGMNDLIKMSYKNEKWYSALPLMMQLRERKAIIDIVREYRRRESLITEPMDWI